MQTREQANTALYPFQKEYAENALLQKGFNHQIIADLCQYILRTKPSCTTEPITILDLCCGDGGSTKELLEELDKHHIKVKQVIGLDISDAQIQLAQKYSKEDPRLIFQMQNVENINYRNEFDVVVSLFGLHWIENISSMAERIHASLKQNGIVVYFVPLEKNELFKLREKLLTSSEWQQQFSGFNVHPFLDTSHPYLTAFEKYFSGENKKGIEGDQPVYFNPDDFIKFLSSWMHEVRFLHDNEKTKKYLTDLISNIPPSKSPTADLMVLNVDDSKKIRFLEKFFWYHGTKKVIADEKIYTGPSLQK